MKAFVRLWASEGFLLSRGIKQNLSRGDFSRKGGEGFSISYLTPLELQIRLPADLRSWGSKNRFHWPMKEGGEGFFIFHLIVSVNK